MARGYMQWGTGISGSGCSAIVYPEVETQLGPMVCGWLAAGPHPDPDKGYRFPLCQTHLEEVSYAEVHQEAARVGGEGTLWLNPPVEA